MLKLYLITGNDEFEIKNKANEIVSDICGCPPDQSSELEIIEGDTDKFKPEEILRIFLNSLQTPPFFTSDKKLWLKHFIYFDLSPGNKNKKTSSKGKKSADKKGDKIENPIKQELTRLAHFFKNPPEYNTIVVIDGPNIDKRSVFFKTCNNIGEVLTFQKTDSSAKNADVVSSTKIRNLCSKYGKKISRDAEDYLLDIASDDSARFHQEMEKLIAYVGDKNLIDLRDCLEVCTKTEETMAWDFADALMKKDLPGAIKAIKNYSDYYKYQTGTVSTNTELIALSTACSRFQTLINVKAFAEMFNISSTCSYERFKSILGNISEEQKSQPLLKGFIYRHPYYIYKLFQQASYFSEEELKRVINALLRANKILVSSNMNSEFVLEQCVMEILGKPS